MVICMECGKKFKILTKTHLNSHRISFDEYFAKHGNVETVDEDIKEKRNKSISESNYDPSKHVEVRCIVCGNVTTIPKYLNDNKIGHCCSDECLSKFHSQRMTGSKNPMKDLQTVKKMVETQRKMGYYDKFGRMIGDMIKSGKLNPMLILKENDPERYKELCEERSKQMKENNPMKNPSVSKKVSEALKEKFKDPEYYDYIRSKTWDNESWRKMNSEDKKKNNPMHNKEVVKKTMPKIFKSMRAKPNKLEQWFIDFFKRYSLDYEYVGDFSYVIGTASPDFINEQEHKIIEITSQPDRTIENYGIPRISYFENYGWKTLVMLFTYMGAKDVVKLQARIYERVRDFEERSFSMCWDAKNESLEVM